MTELEPKPTIFSEPPSPAPSITAQTGSSPKIDGGFNTVEHFLERSELLLCKVFQLISRNHITGEKVELYLYRTTMLIITLVHLGKFLWFVFSH